MKQEEEIIKICFLGDMNNYRKGKIYEKKRVVAEKYILGGIAVEVRE